MLTSYHKIKNTVFDIRFGSRAALMRDHASLGGLIKDNLIPVVGEVLSRNALTDSTICIDKLAIDLGRIHAGSSKGALKKRLGEALDIALKEKIGRVKRSPTSQERIIPGAERQLELIQYFLTTGTLPWTARIESDDIPDRCLQSVIAHKAEDLVRFLEINSHRSQVIQRLVKQFPTGTVRQVVRLLTSVQYETVLKAIDKILRLTKSRTLTGRATADFVAPAWGLLLEYLLQHPNTRFTLAGIERWVAERVENRKSTPTDNRTRGRIKNYQKLSGRSPTSDGLASRQMPPTKGLVSKRLTRRMLKGHDLYEAFRFYLRHGITPWSAGNVAPDINAAKILDELSASYPEKLLKIANDLRNSPDLGRSAAEKLTLSVMNQFITSLVTVISGKNDKDRSTFIRSIIDHTDRAADHQNYYAEILFHLVNRRPIDLEQIAARSQRPQPAAARDVLPEPGPDPDLIRSNLTALLKSSKKSDDLKITFYRLLDSLETKFPAEYQEFVVWLAANKKRFASFAKLARREDVNKSLAYLAGFPGLETRAIAALKGLPVKVNKRGYPQKRLVELASHSRPDDGFLADRRNGKDEAALIGYLTGDQTSVPISSTTARVIFKRGIRNGSDTLYASLRSRLKTPDVRKKMITLLTENWLTRVMASMRPDLHLPVQLYADTMADACNWKEPITCPANINTLKWDFIFKYLDQAANQPFQRSTFIRQFIAFLSDHIPKLDREVFGADLSQNLMANRKIANRTVHDAVQHELTRMEDMESDVPLERQADHQITTENIPDEVVLHNAGMVIAAPYLPKLWAMLGLTEADQFKTLHEAERAVHLLQIMTNKKTESPEYQLVLNKILCGIDLTRPITRRIETTTEEQDAIDGLIRGMIENWKTIGQTSVEGFRESFLQRRGRLFLREDAWHLKVEQRAFDMLLDSIPWGFATIKHPWMQKAVYVKWRQ